MRLSLTARRRALGGTDGDTRNLGIGRKLRRREQVHRLPTKPLGKARSQSRSSSRTSKGKGKGGKHNKGKGKGKHGKGRGKGRGGPIGS